ncbi:MAG: glycosyltransferase [Planctomycetes bacterium]|nr:glycosyltransferase [Planctomycetota bacterium]
MKISLVIPTLDAGTLLEEVLAAIDRQPNVADVEKIAVDSGSTDGTVDRLVAHGFETISIDKSTFDHGLTRDLAIERCSGDIVVLLTQDATPTDTEWLPALVSCFDDDHVGAAYCRQIPRDDCNPFIARRLREWTAGKTERVVQRLASDQTLGSLQPLERLQLCAYDNVAGSVRRSIWEQFKFGKRPFGEDVAFGKKLIEHGYSIVFEPRSAVVHSHNRSPIEEGKRIYCDHQNLRDLFDVHLMPTWESFEGAVEWGQREYAKIVDELDLEPDERAALHRWARDYAKWASLGMYLGANSHQLADGEHGAFFRFLDRELHAGI